MSVVDTGEIRVGARLRARRLERGLTISEVAERSGLTTGFISQLERDLTSASLSSLYRICAVLDLRVGHLVDDVPAGRLIRRDEQARRSLALGQAEHLLLSSGDERRFHVTESHIPPGATAGDGSHAARRRRAGLHAQRVAGAADRRRDARARAGRHAHLLPARPAHVANPSETDEAVVLWTSLPNPYITG